MRITCPAQLPTGDLSACDEFALIMREAAGWRLLAATQPDPGTARALRQFSSGSAQTEKLVIVFEAAKRIEQTRPENVSTAPGAALCGESFKEKHVSVPLEARVAAAPELWAGGEAMRWS
jgi:hypothetical protein